MYRYTADLGRGNHLSCNREYSRLQLRWFRVPVLRYTLGWSNTPADHPDVPVYGGPGARKPSQFQSRVLSIATKMVPRSRFAVYIRVVEQGQTHLLTTLMYRYTADLRRGNHLSCNREHSRLQLRWFRVPVLLPRTGGAETILVAIESMNG